MHSCLGSSVKGDKRLIAGSSSILRILGYTSAFLAAMDRFDSRIDVENHTRVLGYQVTDQMRICTGQGLDMGLGLKAIESTIERATQ